MNNGEWASVSFDRAADYYDHTRTLPVDVMAGVVELLTGELRFRGRCLEVGVGTGRMALPLHGAGVSMAGVDLSPHMLARLVAKAGDRAPFPLAVGDALRLPFSDQAFGAALAVHVLHLIPDWEQALRELRRVVRAGGVILVDVGGPGEGWWTEVQRRFCRAVGLPEQYLGTHRAGEVDQAMAAAGLPVRSLPAIHGHETATPEDRIRRLEDGMYSFTWRVDEATRRRGAASVRRWARRRLGSLEEPREVPIEVSYRAYDLPG